ncbi:MAG: threonylcarbamoyl-AMP synthase [bacterium]|nr:threonylcarbamoyl-AMP synthase [bacterium]
MTQSEISQAVGRLAAGELVGFPTDTVYGIAADPYQEDAVSALANLKGHDTAKPLAVLVADMDQAISLVKFSDVALDLAEEHWPGGLTLVLRRIESVPDWIGDAQARTVGVRCPDHPLALELLESFGPLVVTSANKTGEEPALNADAAAEALGGGVTHYIEGTSGGRVPSTVVDLTRPAPFVLRPGPIDL